jgi:hypothetical protein
MHVICFLGFLGSGFQDLDRHTNTTTTVAFIYIILLNTMCFGKYLTNLTLNFKKKTKIVFLKPFLQGVNFFFQITYSDSH